METIKEMISLKNITIKTKKMPCGIMTSGRWRNDIAHIWLNHKFYRITKNGTMIREELHEICDDK